MMPPDFCKLTAMLRRLLLSSLVLLSFSITIYAQGNVTLVTSGADNCMNPTPNGGTYTPSGTMNGKTQYVKGANLRIIWTGTAWAVQGEDPTIGGINWVTAWNNTRNTAKPPSDCWVANFGCFPITLSGDVALFTTISSISRFDPNPTALSTVNYRVTFNAPVTGVSASNFTVTTAGAITGVSISGVSALPGNVWNVAINTGTNNGSITLSLANATGLSHAFCNTLPFTGNTYTVSKLLPLQLVSFKGILQQEKTLLTWTTVDEANTKHFEVQRSRNGASFAKVDNVLAAGDYTGLRNYEYTDNPGALDKQAPVLWYRLRMIDRDGSFTYSNVVMINMKNAGTAITALPNPFSKQLLVTIEAAQQAPATITLYDVDGKVLKQQQVVLTPGRNSIRLNQLNVLANGSYTLRIQNETLNETIRLLKAD